MRKIFTSVFRSLYAAAAVIAFALPACGQTVPNPSTVTSGDGFTSPRLESHQYSFDATGPTYFDNNLYFRNRTTNGSQCGNAALWMGNAEDGNQIGALFGNMTSTVCGNSVGAVENASYKIGLGDIGGAGARRFKYYFGLNVTNGPNSAYFPNAAYDPLSFDGSTGFFNFYDHLSRRAFYLDTEGHTFALVGVRNTLAFYGGATAGAPMVINAQGDDTNVGIIIGTKNNEGITLQANGAAVAYYSNPSSANRFLTFSGSNGGNPTIGVSAGSLAITPATVFASSISAASLAVGGNVSLADSFDVYTPFNGGTNTGTIRAGVRFNGTSQSLDFYTANTLRGSFNSSGTLALVGGLSAGSFAASASSFSYPISATITGAGGGMSIQTTGSSNPAFRMYDTTGGGSGFFSNGSASGQLTFHGFNNAGAFTATWATLDATAFIAVGTVRSNTGFSANGTAGASATVSVRKGDDSGACNLVFTMGLYTSTTC